MRLKFPKNLFIDTWWFALTKRLSEAQFQSFTQLRKKQGFDGLQLVVGIPPEVGPDHPSASSEVGAAWDLTGKINQKYLDFAAHRIQYLNKLGFTVLVYGAWGHQIEWLGVEGMKSWWKAVVAKLDNYNVIYCICGESNLWIGQEKMLLPNKSTDLLQVNKYIRHIRYLLGIKNTPTENEKRARKKKWSEVLDFVSRATVKPLIIHTQPNEFSYEVVDNPELLSAVTVHTSHSESSREFLWKTVLNSKKNYSKLPFINLEPWYEGIRDRFWAEDQLYALWVTQLAGASGFCYGAQGIWNVGDGHFLSHWGRQTFQDAQKINTPQLINKSFSLIKKHVQDFKTPDIKTRGEKLISIACGKLVFIPHIEFVTNIPAYQSIWLPQDSMYVDQLPSSGQVVLVL